MADIEVGSPPTGTSGTVYDANPAAGRTYGTQYQAGDFHTDCIISDYGDRTQVQACKLSGLPDLNTGKSDVQTELRSYLQALINAGVKGFRLDGAKHMSAQDIAAILNGLTGDFYVFQEVIDQSSSERVRDWEYTPNGDVTEFAYAFALGDAFDDACGGSLSDLQTRFSASDMLLSQFAQVFADNHDNQRGHGVGAGCVVDHRDGQEHVLANIFALAYPYGYPSVMSSFYWQNDSTNNTNDSYGPPGTNNGGNTWGIGLGATTRSVYGATQVADDVPANCSATFENGKWVCEHRRTSTANMVRFRQVTAGETVTDWQNVSADHIAFGLGDKGFVAINRTGSNATTTYNTSLPEGVYCDITKYDFITATGQCVYPGTTTDAPIGDLITVEAGGQIVGKTLNSMDAFAIHIAARLNTDYGTLGNSYGVVWHSAIASNPTLGLAWRSDDGVTRGAWGPTQGVLNLTVNGANGHVTAWFDWNQDGDFADSGEQVFANEPVNAGQTAAKTFDRGIWNYAQPLNARFRVYPAAQTRPAAIDAAPQPNGGAVGGEAEDYSWTFDPLAVFNVSRGTSSFAPLEKLNEWLIPSQSPGGSIGFIYTWHDRSALVAGTPYFYWIEDVDVHSVATRHGPVSVDYTAPSATTLNELQARSSRSEPVLATLLACLVCFSGALLIYRRRSRQGH